MFAHLIGPPWTSQQSLAHWVLQKVRHVNLSFSDYAWSFKNHPPSRCFSPRLFTLPFSWGLELNFSSISSSRCLFLMLSRCETTLCWVSASFKSFSWKVIGEKVDKGGGYWEEKSWFSPQSDPLWNPNGLYVLANRNSLTRVLRR